MQKLNLPEYPFKITASEDKKMWIYDSFRKKKIILTPEEWVRQNLLTYLVKEKEYPASLISIESGIRVNQLEKRYDALIYNRKGAPVMLIECKAPGIPINQNTFDQISAYNLTVSADYFLLSNGLKHYCCRIKKPENKIEFFEDIPAFNKL